MNINFYNKQEIEEEEQINEKYKLLKKSPDEGLVLDHNVYEYQLTFTLYQAVSILLKLDPYEADNDFKNKNFNSTKEVLRQYIEHNLLCKSEITIVKNEFFGDVPNVKVHRDDLITFANLVNIPFNGLPEIKEINLLSKQKNNYENLSKQLEQQLAEAKSEIANLKKLETSCQTVNYDEFSIYGYTSENLKLVFDVIKKLAPKVDKENLHSYPTKEELKAFVKRYLNDNDKLAEAIYQIVIPENVKNRGRTPKGVETFKGFL